MITFPEEFDFILNDYAETHFKMFSKQNPKFLNVNKKYTQPENTSYRCRLILCKEEYDIFETFYSNTTAGGLLPFNINILKDGSKKMINAIFFGSIATSYKESTVEISFTLRKNYDII